MYKKKAILVTGGMDSTALLYREHKNNPIPITIDYGQVCFAKQVENINFHIKKLSLPELVIIKIPFFEWQRKPGLFTPGYIPKEENPLENYDKLRYSDFFVEGRNGIMVLYAAAWCSANKVDELLAGYLYSSEEWQNRQSVKLLTGDNSPQFVDAINLMLQMGFSHSVPS